MSAEASVHAISPKNVVAPRPVGAKRLRGIDLQWIEHGRERGRDDQGVFWNSFGAEAACRNLCVAGSAPEQDRIDGIKPECFKYMRGKQSVVAMARGLLRRCERVWPVE